MWCRNVQPRDSILNSEGVSVFIPVEGVPIKRVSKSLCVLCIGSIFDGCAQIVFGGICMNFNDSDVCDNCCKSGESVANLATILHAILSILTASLSSF